MNSQRMIAGSDARTYCWTSQVPSSGSGEIYTYDVNTNTNYNGQAEEDAGVAVTGMGAVARFLGDELAQVNLRASAVAAE